ncbi:MAG: TetR/AcrR family transcriptional regulator [Clostridia bacterium]|nr:TetR/AcrR family transcriptional regulator [Clostridia bacterium]
MNKSESKYFNTALKFDNALLSLLEKKPFEYITIREICEEAGVNRSTFYLHYENTCDLLEEATRYIIDKFISYFPSDLQLITSNFTKCDITELNFITEDYLTPYLSFIRDNKRTFRAILSQPSTFKFDLFFEKLFEDIFAPVMNRFRYPDSEQKYVLMFYLSGLHAVMLEWLKNDCSKSIPEVTEIIRSCIFGREDKWGIRPSKN